MSEDIVTKEELDQLTLEQLKIIVLEFQETLKNTEAKVDRKNKLKVLDFEIESSEPLEEVQKQMDKLIEKHGDFAISRRNHMILSDPRSYIG